MNPFQKTTPKDKKIRIDQGKIFISQEMERTFFFVATLLMLIAGILFKTGIF